MPLPLGKGWPCEDGSFRAAQGHEHCRLLQTKTSKETSSITFNHCHPPTSRLRKSEPDLRLAFLTKSIKQTIHQGDYSEYCSTAKFTSKRASLEFVTLGNFWHLIWMCRSMQIVHKGWRGFSLPSPRSECPFYSNWWAGTSSNTWLTLDLNLFHWF